MKSKFIAITLMAAGLMMSAYNNQQKNDNTPVESDSTENTEVTDLPEDGEEIEYSRRGIETIREQWKGKTIKVDANNNTLGIKQLALAFCKTFPECETNMDLKEFLSSPNADKDTYDEERSYASTGLFGYHIDNNSRNGYIRCMLFTQTDRFTYVCYWNRKNGHKLFAAFMEECWESANWEQCLIVFYDYDPATGIMTPEPALTDMIEKRMKKYDVYSVRLPEKGKDITVEGFIFGAEDDEEDGVFDELELKWDGTTFNWAD